MDEDLFSEQDFNDYFENQTSHLRIKQKNYEFQESMEEFKEGEKNIVG